MKETLVILAAGMGSRYGGLKQIDQIGSNGESIIEFTIYDAIKTGFKKVVLIIRKEHQNLFEENLGKKIRPFIELEYAYQDINDIPVKIDIPLDRTKPWGTTHALLSTKNIIKDDPFIVCNADDFYGRNSFIKAYDFIHNGLKDNYYCMVGFKIENTLSLNGTVTRGICAKNNDNLLTEINEVANIKWNNNKNGVLYEKENNNIPIELGTPTSMNFWCFNPSIYDNLYNVFKEEFSEGVKNNPLKYEALLPSHIGKLINNNMIKVQVLTSESKWFGVTYKDDKEYVANNIQDLKDNGTYPTNFWK